MNHRDSQRIMNALTLPLGWRMVYTPRVRGGIHPSPAGVRLFECPTEEQLATLKEGPHQDRFMSTTVARSILITKYGVQYALQHQLTPTFAWEELVHSRWSGSGARGRLVEDIPGLLTNWHPVRLRWAALATCICMPPLAAELLGGRETAFKAVLGLWFHPWEPQPDAVVWQVAPPPQHIIRTART
jgi:hypothetical protein